MMKLNALISNLKRIRDDHGDMTVKAIGLDGRIGDPRVYSEHKPGEQPYLCIRAKDGVIDKFKES